MADILDQADDAVEMLLRASISTKKKAGPQADGTCHNCGEHIADGLRWCDTDCRDDWTKREARSAQ